LDSAVLSTNESGSWTNWSSSSWLQTSTDDFLAGIGSNVNISDGNVSMNLSTTGSWIDAWDKGTISGDQHTTYTGGFTFRQITTFSENASRVRIGVYYNLSGGSAFSASIGERDGSSDDVVGGTLSSVVSSGTPGTGWVYSAPLDYEINSSKTYLVNVYIPSIYGTRWAFCTQNGFYGKEGVNDVDQETVSGYDDYTTSRIRFIRVAVSSDYTLDSQVFDAGEVVDW